VKKIESKATPAETKDNALTEVERQTYDVIAGYISSHGYSPTFSELCDMLDVSSKNTIEHRLIRMKEKGALTFEFGKARTIQLLGK
jgi:SOS-response transcriptional repressor LexA